MEGLSIITDNKKLSSLLWQEGEAYWLKKGDEMALNLFHQMAERVPAYKDFLKKANINHTKIQAIQDFKKYVPLVDKNSYCKEYPLASLCWDGKFSHKQWTISTTSGSTGEPFYFPRTKEQMLQYAAYAENYLLTNFEIDKKSTLYIVGFPMGAWIGGLFTYEALRIISERGNYHLSVITPGINKLEIIKAIKKLGKEFDQVIIGSYGPFLKDTLDDGVRMGIKWDEYNLGFVFSAEAFSETFRDYVIKTSGAKNEYKATLNHYGTVDLGTMSYETPLAVMVRRLATKNENLYKALFGELNKLPTFTQYLPELFYFEEVDGNLICSANAGIPLCRYDLKDRGSVLTYTEVLNILKTSKVDLEKEISKGQINDSIWKLPFVYVYERSDFSVSFYAFQVYPETIRRALQNTDLENDITGKFTMMVKFDDKSDQYLEINIELKAEKTANPDLERRIVDKLVSQLINDSSEYKATYQQYGAKINPRIVFWHYEDPTYFKPGIKQKWVKKD